MKATSAIESLGALAQEHRLALFRLLVRAGDKGMAAGAIADQLSVPNSSLSFHLAQLRTAGLILQERQHRSLIYRANYPAMNALVAYLMENSAPGRLRQRTRIAKRKAGKEPHERLHVHVGVTDPPVRSFINLLAADRRC